MDTQIQASSQSTRVDIRVEPDEAAEVEAAAPVEE